MAIPVREEVARLIRATIEVLRQSPTTRGLEENLVLALNILEGKS